MEKVVVTGHTEGIGKAIYDYFSSNSTVLGFSRSNGFDISKAEDREKIISAASDASIFVNNAYSDTDDSQLLVLQGVLSAWHGQTKTIINISSRYAGDYDDYSRSKKKLDDLCTSRDFQMPRVINIKPGLTDTKRVSKKRGEKMSTDDVIKILHFVLCQLPAIRITSITFGV